MAKTSYYGRIIDIEDAAFDQGSPVSAGEAFLLRQNLAHAIDESTQMRISWGSQRGATYGVHYYSIGASLGCRYLEEFPITWLAPDKPANLYVYAVVKCNTSPTSDYSYRVSIVPANTPPGQGASQAIFDQSGTNSDSAITTITGNVIGADFIQQLRSAWQVVGLTDDGDAFRHASLCMLRLEIELSGSLESTSEIIALYVMEYA